MDFEKIKKHLPYAWAGLPCIGAVIIFILAIVNDHTPVKVMMFICSALMIVLAGLVFAYYFIFGERRRNYFLTDVESGRNKRLADLTFEDVNDRMNYFMAKRISDDHELWTGGFLGKRGMFGAQDVFKPLAIYKMLFDLGESNSYDYWRLFFEMPDSDFARMINCLDSVDDVNMSRKLTSLRSFNDATKTDRLADFITKNKKYICGKMMNYVRANIDKFDEVKR